jgi:hypothetical protein
VSLLRRGTTTHHCTDKRCCRQASSSDYPLSSFGLLLQLSFKRACQEKMPSLQPTLCFFSSLATSSQWRWQFGLVRARPVFNFHFCMFFLSMSKITIGTVLHRLSFSFQLLLHHHTKITTLFTLQLNVCMVFIFNGNSLSLEKFLIFLNYSLGIFPNEHVFELFKKHILNNVKIEWCFIPA